MYILEICLTIGDQEWTKFNNFLCNLYGALSIFMCNISDITIYPRYQIVTFGFDKSLIFLLDVRCAILGRCQVFFSEHTDQKKMS